MIGKRLKAAAAYFGIVFGTGFLLGLIRVLWLVPRVGERAAELLEMPVMVAVSILAGAWVVRRYRESQSTGAFLTIGLLALAFLVTFELALALLRGISVSDYFTGRDPLSGTAYFIALALMGITPAVLSARTSRVSFTSATGRGDKIAAP